MKEPRRDAADRQDEARSRCHDNVSIFLPNASSCRTKSGPGRALAGGSANKFAPALATYRARTSADESPRASVVPGTPRLERPRPLGDADNASSPIDGKGHLKEGRLGVVVNHPGRYTSGRMGIALRSTFSRPRRLRPDALGLVRDAPPREQPPARTSARRRSGIKA